MSADTRLLVTTSFPLAGDGSEAAGAFVGDVAQALAAAGPVRVVAPGPGETRRDLGGRVELWTFAGPGKPLSLLSPRRPADWPAILSTLASLRRVVRAAAADGRVASALALWVLPSGWALRDLFRRQGIPYQVWALGSDVWTLGRLPLVRGLFRRVAADASRCHADGLALARDAAAIAGRPFEFLPSVRQRDATAARPPRTAPPYRLLFLGRWHPNKGVDLLIEALSRLPEATWQRIAGVEIAGGGPLEASVRAGCQALQAAGRPVRASGFLDRDAATAALQGADYVLIPSRIESIPLVLADALAQGRPVVATPVGDLPGLVAGEPPCGVLAAAPGAGAIAAAITAAVDGPPDRFQAGVRAVAARFSLDAVVARLLEPGHGHD